MLSISAYFPLSAKNSRKLRPNKKPIRTKDFASLISLLLPGFFFGIGLFFLSQNNTEYFWLHHLSHYPLELWVIVISGSLATLGGIGDWVFHRLYVATSPRESKSHLLALATGGLPLFIFMALASISPSPQDALLPILVSLLYTVTLICYDEFVFHIHRCGTFETSMHRLLVFGNGIAFLAWFHWIYLGRAVL